MGRYELAIGDILYAVDSKDIGILLRCYGDAIIVLEKEHAAYAWEIYWMKDGTQFYSEFGLHVRLDATDFLKLGYM